MAIEFKRDDKDDNQEQEKSKKMEVSEKSIIGKIMIGVILLIAGIIAIFIFYAFDWLSHTIKGKEELGEETMAQIDATLLKQISLQEIFARTDPHPETNEYGGIDLYVYEISTECIFEFLKESKNLDIGCIYKIEYLKIIVKKELESLKYKEFSTIEARKKLAERIRNKINNFFKGKSLDGKNDEGLYRKYFPKEEVINEEILKVYLNHFNIHSKEKI